MSSLRSFQTGVRQSGALSKLKREFIIILDMEKYIRD